MSNNIKNFMKKPKLVFDGLEEQFIDRANVLKCPVCYSNVTFTLRNAMYLNDLDESIQKKSIKDIHGVKYIDCKKRYPYKGSAIFIYASECVCNEHKFSVVFTFEEVQPARCISWLIGLVVIDC